MRNLTSCKIFLRNLTSCKYFLRHLTSCKIFLRHLTSCKMFCRFEPGPWWRRWLVETAISSRLALRKPSPSFYEKKVTIVKQIVLTMNDSKMSFWPIKILTIGGRHSSVDSSAFFNPVSADWIPKFPNLNYDLIRTTITL